MKSKNDGSATRPGGDVPRDRITALESACQILHSAEVDLWDTVEQLRESLSAWLAYPDLEVQERAAEMLTLIEEALERVVQRRTAQRPRSGSAVAAAFLPTSPSAVKLDKADEE